MNVDPIVREEFLFCDDHADSQKITISEFVGRLDNFKRCRWIELLNKFRERHAGDEFIA